MSTEVERLKEYLELIAARSSRGEISWSQVNPSSYTWNSPGRSVTIQKASTPKLESATSGKGLLSGFKLENDYLFQVTDRTNRQLVVSLSSKERPEFSTSLAAIFDSIERGMDVRAADVLKNLLE